MDGIVLVHGSFVDASCWNGVVGSLRNRGHRVEAVELHRGSLAADTEAAQEAVDQIGGPVVVCGWSYGGMVITGLQPLPGSHLVYLCALVPDEGESAMSLGERYPSDFDGLLGADSAGDLVLAGDCIDAVLWGDAPPDRAAAARASLRSQAMASFVESPVRVAWRDTPSTYVVGLRDRVFQPELVREMAERATHVVEWDTSHSAVLSQPDLIVGLLANLADQN